MRVFDCLSLNTVGGGDRPNLKDVDQDPYIPGPADGVLSIAELKVAWEKVQRLADGDPLKESIRQAATAVGILEGEVPFSLFGDWLSRIRVDDFAPEARAVARLIDHSVGLQSNHDGYLDKTEIANAINRMDETDELSPAQKAYLQLFGKLLRANVTAG